MDKVKESVRSGVPLLNAVRARLLERGVSVKEISEKHHVSRTHVMSGLSGNGVLSDKAIAMLIAELGGTVEEWSALLSDAVRQRYESRTAAAAVSG